jgi:prophage tail gpP-like protein
MGENIVELKVGGRRYMSGWLRGSVRKSLFSVVGSFSLATTNIYVVDRPSILIGKPCVISIDGQSIIDGYIEEIPIQYSADSHSIQVNGRDKTCDLVDCAFAIDASEWNNQSVLRIIESLCDNFEIDVVVEPSAAIAASTKMVTKRVDIGMTVGEIILDLCKMHSILPVSYGDGKLTLTRAGAYVTEDSLRLGDNILTGSFNQSNRDRFQTYIVVANGQDNDDETSIEDIVAVHGLAYDNTIQRYRPTIIIPESTPNTGQCVDRANWEARIRAAKSKQLSYSVRGWTQSNGDVWPLNALVNVEDDFLKISSQLLISEVTYILSNEQGKVTELGLIDPAGLEAKPFVESDEMKSYHDEDW